MAGVREAMKRVMDGKNLGTVVAEGYLQECGCEGEGTFCSDCKNIRYIIIRLLDGGLITQYDIGSDIHIADNIKVYDRAFLMINDNWNATWEGITEEDIANHIEEDLNKRVIKKSK